MDSENASCPLEQAADQIVIWREVEDLATSGSRCWVKASNGWESRNHDVSLVVSASTTASVSWASPLRSRTTRAATSLSPKERAIGASRDSTRYSLPGCRSIELRWRTIW